MSTASPSFPLHRCLLWIPAALLLSGLPDAAAGQLAARISDIKNLVKVRARSATAFSNASVGMALSVGDNVRTGARSQAKAQFTDRSVLRIGELSDVVIRPGYQQRDVNVEAGRVYGDYRGPGRFRGRYAVAAVRGTRSEMAVETRRTVSRCWTGSVAAAGAGVQLIAGRIAESAPDRFRSEALAQSEEDWIGARVVFPGSALESRRVAAFDAATGAVTLDAALPAAPGAGTEFLLINPPDAPYVIVPPGFETFVLHQPNAAPVPPYPTEPELFAGGEEFSWLSDRFAGNRQSLLLGRTYEQFRARYYQLHNARDAGSYRGGYAPGIQDSSYHSEDPYIPPPGDGTGTGGTGVEVGAGVGGVGVVIGSPSVEPPGGELAPGRFSTRAAPLPAGSARFVQPQILAPPRARSGVFGRRPEIGGVAYTTNDSDTALAFANASAILGDALVRIGGQIGTLDRGYENRIDEFMLRFRNESLGDIRAGRFRWFPGPITTGVVGRLVSFSTADGILWQLPTGDSVQAEIGWFDKMNPQRGPNVGGYMFRATFPAGRGRVGLTGLSASGQGRDLGLSADFIVPVLPQKLELYGEVGRDPLRQHFHAFGLYLPGLFHRFGIDVFFEYAYRENNSSSLDLNVHVPLGRHFGALLTLTKPAADAWQPGIGLIAQF